MPRTVAAFDFDGTLSTRDNVVPFLRFVGGPWQLIRALLRAAPALVTGRRDLAKAHAARIVFAGRAVDSVDRQGAAFATDVVLHHMHEETVQRAAWHRSQGHELVIVSASFTAYLDPIAEQLGFDAVLATRLEVGPDGMLTGRLLGANVRGAEKVRVLDAWLGTDPAIVWAYGDSGGDRELLARADHAYLRGDEVR